MITIFPKHNYHCKARVARSVSYIFFENDTKIMLVWKTYARIEFVYSVVSSICLQETIMLF